MENSKEDVKRYDAHADMSIVEKLCSHLHMAMQDPDGKWVAASDKKEEERVLHWQEKHLGLSLADAKSNFEKVAQEMHKDRHKNRVTFYYLLAKQAGKLAHMSL